MLFRTPAKMNTKRSPRPAKPAPLHMAEEAAESAPDLRSIPWLASVCAQVPAEPVAREASKESSKDVGSAGGSPTPGFLTCQISDIFYQRSDMFRPCSMKRRTGDWAAMEVLGLSLPSAVQPCEPCHRTPQRVLMPTVCSSSCSTLLAL